MLRSFWNAQERRDLGTELATAILDRLGLRSRLLLCDLIDDHPFLLTEQAEVEPARRQEQVARREEKAARVEERLQGWSQRLRKWEGDLETREQRVDFVAKMSAQPRDSKTKVGRSERCPCGSGLKYKHCHGLPGRAQDRAP